MGTLEAVGRICLRYGQAYAVTKEEMQYNKRAKEKAEPVMCEKCRK